VSFIWRSWQIVSQFLAVSGRSWHDVTKAPVLPVVIEPLQQLDAKAVSRHYIRRRLLLQLSSKHISEEYHSTQCKPASVAWMDADAKHLLHSHNNAPCAKVKVMSICTAPIHGTSLRRSGISCIVKGYHSYLYTLCFIHKRNEPYLLLLSQLQLVLIYLLPFTDKLLIFNFSVIKDIIYPVFYTPTYEIHVAEWRTVNINSKPG